MITKYSKTSKTWKEVLIKVIGQKILFYVIFLERVFLIKI